MRNYAWYRKSLVAHHGKDLHLDCHNWHYLHNLEFHQLLQQQHLGKSQLFILFLFLTTKTQPKDKCKENIIYNRIEFAKTYPMFKFSISKYNQLDDYIIWMKTERITTMLTSRSKCKMFFDDWTNGFGKVNIVFPKLGVGLMKLVQWRFLKTSLIEKLVYVNHRFIRCCFFTRFFPFFPNNPTVF